MPGKAGTSKKTKKGAKQEEILLPPKGDGGVAAALVWRSAADAKGRKPPPPTQRTEKFIPQKAELGRAQNRGYVYPDEDQAHCPPPQQHEENVLQALRGWPGARDEEADQFTQTELDLYREESGKKKKKKTQQKEKVHLKVTEPEKPDPYMTELIAHVFMSRAEQERLAKLAAEEEAKNNSKKKTQPNGNNIKSNRTAQLRAIALAGNVPVDPKDLWQMKKFKNTKAHLETTRKGQKSKQDDDDSAGEHETGCGNGYNGDTQLRGYTPVDLPNTPGNKTPDVYHGYHFASDSPAPLQTDRSYDQYNYELEAY